MADLTTSSVIDTFMDADTASAARAAIGATAGRLKPRGAAHEYDVVDDFIRSHVFFINSNSGSGGAGSGASSLDQAPAPFLGAVTLETGTNSDGSARFESYSNYYNPNVQFPTSGSIAFGTRVCLPVLSDGTNHYIFAVCIQDSGGNSRTAIEYDHTVHSGRWRCKTNGTEIADSGVTVAANTWYTLEVSGNQSLVSFHINGSLIGTISTNIPTDPLVYGVRILKQAGSTSRRAVVDWGAIGLALT